MDSKEGDEARALIEQAKKKKDKWFGGNTKYEEAAQLYDKAGTKLRIAKAYPEAAAAFIEAAACHVKINNTMDAAASYVKAGKCYTESKEGEEAKIQFEQAITLYSSEGNVAAQAKALKELAEVLEEDNKEAAAEAYTKAANVFRVAESESVANTCELKAADLLSEDGKFAAAAAVYDKVGKAYLENNLLKFNAKTIFFKALLCFLATEDVVTTRTKTEEYKDMDVQFPDSRQCKLCEALTTAFEAQAVGDFVGHLAEYDRVSKLDRWSTSILLKIKTKIEEATRVDLT